MSNINVRNLVNDRIPCQVRFWDGENYCTGIMVGKLLICGCCDGTFDLDEVIEMAKADDKVAVSVFEYWIDIDDAINGGEPETAIPLEF